MSTVRWRLVHRAIGLALFVLVPISGVAGWREVVEADAALDLESARRLAMATIADDGSSIDAVATAYWWLANINNLADPDEILALADDRSDPELRWVLAKIESELASRAPAGALQRAELAGPFGVFNALDIERDVVPEDAALPPLGTRWSDRALPYRLTMSWLDGRVGPPLAMIIDGVYLAAWSLVSDPPMEGWLVIEADGSFNLELDGRGIDRRRDCGLVDPGVNWYRIALGTGSHRLRIAMASRDAPRVRVSLLDNRGMPATSVRVIEEPLPAAAASATIDIAVPTARATFEERFLDSNQETGGLLMAAQLARGRGDPRAERQWLERALAGDPENPWPAMELARHLLLQPTGSEGTEDERRARELLRRAGSIPRTALLERSLASRQGRTEDADRILDDLMATGGADVRVLRIWVREAVRRGWAREAEEGLERLSAALPGVYGVTGLRLEVLAALQRWDERTTLLESLAAATPVVPRWIGQMSSSCLVDEALAATATLANRVNDPDLDIQLIQTTIDHGDIETASHAVRRARDRWGDLPAIDELELVLAATQRVDLEPVLDAALERQPSDLQLLTLSWRLGSEPFYSEFRLDGRRFAEERPELNSDTDVVLLLDQAVERIFADGSSLYYYHGLTRANTPAGAQLASVLQPLPDAYLLQVRIYKPDGTIVIPSDITSSSAGPLTISGVTPGDLVEEEYVARVEATGTSRRGHLPPYIYRFADPDRAFGLSEYVLLVPREVDLAVDGNFTGLERTESEWRGLRLLRWRTEAVPPVAAEPFGPPAQDLLPWLNYGFGVTWSDVGDAVRDRVLPVMRSSPELRAWSAALTEARQPDEAVGALVEGLVDTIEAGNGELALGTTAAESFALRRGNRLGILATVLADLGWEVDLVLTRPRTQRGSRLEVPTLDAFPAAVLRVTRDDSTVWIDIREERRGVNHINPLFQGSDGLVLPLTRPGEPVTLLDELPNFVNPDLEETVRVRAVVTESGDARIDFSLPIRGAQAERIVERVRSVPQDQVPLVFQQLAVSLFPAAEDVTGEIGEADGRTTLEIGLTVREACERAESELVCRSLVLSNPLVPVLASLPERKFPLVLRVPLLRRVELEVDAPHGWQAVERSPRRIDTRWGSVSETVDDEPGRRTSVLSVEIPAQTVMPDDYPEFARFCQAVDELSMRPPRLLQTAP